MATRQYVGARYVPKFADPVEWDNVRSYEALTIVQHLNNSFTSKKPVPAGVDISDDKYWVNTGNYNAKIDELTNQTNLYLKDVKNAKYLGFKTGAENADVNTALANVYSFELVYFPAGDYYFNGTYTIRDGGGVIGKGTKYTKFFFSGSDGFSLPVYNTDSDSVYSTVVVKDLQVLGSSGKGLNFYNYPFAVTYNRNVEQYKQNVNNGYALEYRNSVIDNLYIGGFDHCIYSDNFTSLIRITRTMLVNAKQSGITMFASDSIIDSSFITLCTNGIIGHGECNMYNNVKVYMCGQNNGSGFYLGEYALENMLTNVSIQENMHSGLVVENNNGLCLNGVVADGNGFEDGTSAGFNFYNTHNVTGSIFACDKNPSPTQRIGAYCDSRCNNFNVNYAEYNNKNPLIYAGGFTFGLLMRRMFVPLTVSISENVSTDDVPYAMVSDGTLSIHIKGTIANAIAGTDICTLEGMYASIDNNGNIPSSFAGYLTSLNGKSATYYFAGNTLTLGSDVEGPLVFELNTKIPLVYN